ncbi:hypothetical protein BBJ28_00020699 [Nothophytophthora sp. Chile5]|nr:hypothetical protein BBJ28_00020699 [Nothophytophthora sp. Chile5]
MPFKSSYRSTTTLTSSYRSDGGSTVSTRTASDSPQSPPRKVRVDDDELVRRSHSNGAVVALKQAVAQPVDSWDSKSLAPCIKLGPSEPDSDGFTLLSRVVGDSREGHEVLTTGDLNCSPRELAAVMRSTNENEYNTAMKGLYRGQFIYGSVVHVVTGYQQTKRAQSPLKATPELPENHQLAVKTGCFARSRIFSRNEQWCFLEHFQPTSIDTTGEASDPAQGFSILLSSLPEHELAAGKAVGGRVDQLNGVTALYVVEPLASTNSSNDANNGVASYKKVRVTFHALYTETDGAAAGQATSKMARNRLMTLAGGVHRLPVLVRRRRLGRQVFSTASAVAATFQAEAQNSRCISCTKGLRLSTMARCARRCQLCSYNVCTSCWSRESVETFNGHVATMGVCARCLECVDRCDYSHIQIDRHGPSRIVDDPVSPSQRPRRSSMARSLRESLSVESTKNAAVTVIRCLLGQQSSDTDDESEEEDPEVEDDETYMTAVEEYFRRRAREAPAAADCVLANAEQRAYPLQLVDESSPVAPIPVNEATRLECISKFGLMELGEPMPELDIICSFLGKELGFMCTMITIVGGTHQLVLSCTMKELVQARLPREHTFCQHLLMGDAPFMVQNPEADVRFYNLNPVTQQGVRFYCGIPIMGPRGVMVGSICCVHFAPMDITSSQFATLQRFGQIASKIIRVKATAKLKAQQQRP